jgi:uncharacterized cupredoxin-like copper-binding protein
MSDEGPRRRPGPWRRAVPWFVTGLLLAISAVPIAAAVGALPSAPPVGYAHPVNATAPVTVNMTDTPRFVPRSLVGTSNSTLEVHLVNQGQYNHTFTVSRVPHVVLNTSWTPVDLDRWFAANGTLANVSVAPGHQAYANVTLNASTGGDSFEFVSLVPFQFQAGMYGFLNVTSSGPGLLISENTTDSLQFVPNQLGASPAHFPVSIDVLVTNTGSFGHTFTMAAQPNYTLSPANFTTYFAAHPPLVSVTVPSGAGSTVWANFSVAAAGVYQYICEVPGHFASGMTGFLYVGVPVPPPVSPPSSAIVETWVLAGSGALVVVGVLLAIAASFTGRFPRRPRGGHGGHTE